ncbi:winged helix-turn-helix domain-containing protein, partial [Clostridioides difficile]
KNTINIKDLKIDFGSSKVFKGDKELLLTKKELELIRCLINNKGMVLSREKLLDLVWGLDYEGDFRTVDTHIRRLRVKIGEDIIKTYRGLGYSLEDFND